MRPFRHVVFLAAILAAGRGMSWAEDTRAVVIVPVADLRSEASLPARGQSDDKEETQLLYGERVIVHASSGDWAQIEATEQPSYKYHNRWEGYPGWILQKSLALDAPYDGLLGRIQVKWASAFDRPDGTAIFQLPLGSLVRIGRKTWAWAQIDLPNNETGWVRMADLHAFNQGAEGSSRDPSIRGRILHAALLLKGDPYVWGGLSPHDPADQLLLSGVDCSGLVHLAYRVNGVPVPRDANEQWMQAEKIKRAQLAPADLIFSARAGRPDKIVHVALYAGGGRIIEAPQTGMAVRKIAFKEKYGKDLAAVESGDTVGERVIYFGRLLAP